jgi:hypothetical protein
MVNHENLTLSETGEGAQAIFRGSIHQRFFNIVLVDFLSQSERELFGKELSCLDALNGICERPNFNRKNSIRALRVAVKKFASWLDREIKVPIWLPTIDLDTKLLIKRHEFIKICGDISKHNFSRLGRRAKSLRSILSRSNVNINIEDGLLILDDFYERFHIDIFTYHGSSLVEYLNNIRWGIQEYLEPHLKESIVYGQETPSGYKYTYPRNVDSAFAKSCYWQLMNEIKSAPYFKRFKTYQILKKMY